MVRFLFQCPMTKTGNLYSALQDSDTKQKLVKVDTKVCGRRIVYMVITIIIIHFQERSNSRGLASQSRAQQTVATYFRYSLMDLLQKMVAGSPQFIRCIKPNEAKEARKFESAKVLKQLRYTGVLETIRIRQNGFSHRFPFADFLKRYCFLGFTFQEKVVANRENCRLLLVRLKMDGWALGKSKVFLKYYHVEKLARLYEERIRKVILVQALARRWLAKRLCRKKKRELAESVVTLQRHVRGWLTRRRFEKAKEKRENELQEKKLQEQKRKLLEKLKLTRQESKNKENLDVEAAAKVIQNCRDLN